MTCGTLTTSDRQTLGQITTVQHSTSKKKTIVNVSIKHCWLLLLFLMFKGCECKQVHCDFNQLCFCQNYSAQYIDVTCVNVPLVSVPSFSRYQHLYRIRLIGVPELTQLKPNDFRNLITLASLSISKSRLSYVNPDTFKKVAIRHTLITLDLSYGNLIEIPVNALIHLHQLQWLSLKGNQIEIIKAKELKELKTLQTLLLNENSISIVEDRTFHKLPNLELIDFDGNMIERVEGNPFPPSLKSLSLSNCLLRKIPFSSIENLPNLQILQLHGNLISYLSPFKLQVDQMESIDLSHNLISNLPHNLFSLFNRSQSESFTESINAPNTNKSSSIIELNKSIIVSEQLTANVRDSPSLQIERFHLDFNFIQSLPPNLFRDILIKKLTLSSNRISSQLISPNAFQGPLESNLQVLDLNYNLIDKYPLALKSLRMLKQLLLKNNRIKQIDFDSFHKCSHTLEALDLSQNLLEAVPTKALSALKNLIKINLHDNLIKSVTSNELDGWCHKLKSLTLSKNVLLSIGYQTFNRCNKLSELRLGGNKLLQLSSDTLTHHLASLQLLDLSSLNVNRWLHGNDNVQTLPQVKWLQFDFNHLRTIPQRLIQLFPSLMYLDLQNNHISQLSNNLKDIKNLTTIILSHNNLTTISSKAFSELNKLENVALYFNRIQQVKKFAFYGLPRLQSLVLSKNQIKHIDTDAFYNLSTKSNTLTLMLDENHLECLSANSFRHITTGNISSLNDFALYLNVSHNQIKTLANCPGSGNAKTNIKRTAVAAVHNNQREQTLLVRVLDISFNQISQLTQDFLLAFCGQCLSLFVNNNFIRSLPLHLLPLCPHLQTLSINFNYISGVEKGLQLENKLMTVDSNTTDNQTITLQIQTLSLQHNRISELTDFEQLFHLLVHLKTLDLTGNQIKQIPTNIFSRTSIVKLNLAHNSLSMEVVEDKCFGIEHSLKYLDISYNSLTLLPNRIVSCSNLIELLVSNNRIHSFYHLMPLWKALSNLHRLELFNNPVQSIDQRISFPFVNNHSMLSILNLNSLNIVHLEELNVPYLFDLDLSENQISTINSKILSRSRNIRHLNLAFNKLTEVPKHIWKYVTRLRYLSLQDNPIEILDSSSFAGLKYLNFLDIRGLKLQYIDSRIFLYQSQLSKLKISTYPQIRSFRLQDILAKSDALKTAVIDVKESILSHQIQWAFGGKLRELILTGTNLVTILPDAFQGLNNANDLTLRITNTSIQHLPEGLLRYLADIRYITIDLKNNLLETVSPNVFFNRFNKNPVKSWQSRQLLGGIILENNPLKCDCNLLWISKWMKEIFTEMKSINIEAAIHVKSTLSLSRCNLASRPNQLVDADRHSARQIPITHLRDEDIGTPCDTTNASTPMKYQFLLIQYFYLLACIHKITAIFIY